MSSIKKWKEAAMREVLSKGQVSSWNLIPAAEASVKKYQVWHFTSNLSFNWMTWLHLFELKKVVLKWSIGFVKYNLSAITDQQ